MAHPITIYRTVRLIKAYCKSLIYFIVLLIYLTMHKYTKMP